MAVGVGVNVAIGAGAGVNVGVGVGVGVGLDVSVGVGVGLDVGVGVGLDVGIGIGVSVSVGIVGGVGVELTGPADKPAGGPGSTSVGGVPDLSRAAIAPGGVIAGGNSIERLFAIAEGTSAAFSVEGDGLAAGRSDARAAAMGDPERSLRRAVGSAASFGRGAAGLAPSGIEMGAIDGNAAIAAEWLARVERATAPRG